MQGPEAISLIDGWAAGADPAELIHAHQIIGAHLHVLGCDQQVQALVYAARRAAVEDSNDGEIAALNEALDAALARWLHVDATGEDHQHKHIDDEGMCKVCGTYAPQPGS